jgi:hypothetical protein
MDHDRTQRSRRQAVRVSPNVGSLRRKLVRLKALEIEPLNPLGMAIDDRKMRAVDRLSVDLA